MFHNRDKVSSVEISAISPSVFWFLSPSPPIWLFLQSGSGLTFSISAGAEFAHSIPCTGSDGLGIFQAFLSIYLNVLQQVENILELNL